MGMIGALRFGEIRPINPAMPDLVLYNRHAEPFPLSTPAWRELLKWAKELGWRPAGTLKPPIALDAPRPAEEPKWSGAYDPACGQTVTRADAEALIAAIESSQPHLQEVVSIDLVKFIRFANKGGFLVCSQTKPLPDTGSSLSQLHRALTPETPSAEESPRLNPTQASRS